MPPFSHNKFAQHAAHQESGILTVLVSFGLPTLDKLNFNHWRNLHMNWHQKIFPVVTIIIFVLATVFIAVSFLQFSNISSYLQSAPSSNPQLIIDKALNVSPEQLKESFETGAYIPQWAGLFMLESVALEKRHHQANALLASRLWIRYLSVVSGMILVTVGSIFILAKLQDSSTEIQGETESIKLKVASASPGLILAMLGTALILTALLNNPTIELKDGKVYMGNESEALPRVAQ
jgi:hypothetical protein